MTAVTYAHRTGELRADAAEYNRSLEAVAEQLANIGWITSLIVCGSYAKGSLSPGWSDLDLVAVYEGGLNNTRIEQLRLNGEGRANPGVPVGIDFVQRQMLVETRRVVGRPLAMSKELRQYASPVFGENPFLEIAEEPDDHQRIEHESELLVRSDANSFLRRSVAGYSSDRERIFDAVKTLLRIAMFESSGLKRDGVTVADYCSAVRSVTPSSLVSRVLFEAEALRVNWTQVSLEAEQFLYPELVAALVYYCEEWRPSWTNGTERRS